MIEMVGERWCEYEDAMFGCSMIGILNLVVACVESWNHNIL